MDRVSSPWSRAWWARGARGAVSAARLAALVAVLVSGCRPSDPRFEVETRILAVLEPSTSPVVARGWTLDGEQRPAVGGPNGVHLRRRHHPFPTGSALLAGAPLPPELRKEPLVFVPSVRSAEKDGWIEKAPHYVPAPGPLLPLVLDVGGLARTDHVETLVEVLPLARSWVFETAPLHIPRKAWLELGVGFPPFAGPIGAAPVALQVTATTVAGETPLLRATIDPRPTSGWQDHRLDLAAFGDRTVRLRLVAAPVQPEGRPPLPAVAPLWSAPRILAPRRSRAQRNVLLVSVDTLRGDFPGSELSGRRVTPFLDELAAQATVFTRAYTTYPSTTAAHMSMLTGVYPTRHEMGVLSAGLRSGIPTLAEMLAAQGYGTAAFTENGLIFSGYGFANGFDTYREFKGAARLDTPGMIDATFGAGLEWLRAHRDQKLFMFLHSYQVHNPFTPPPGHDLFTTYRRDGREVPVSPAVPDLVANQARYAGEVHHVDEVLRRLFADLAALGVLDDTIVIVTADHGEEFGEHDSFGHGMTLHEEVLHVPLIVRAPKLVPAGLRIDTPVSLVDIVPTVLALIGIPPPTEIQGMSLVPLVHGKAFPKGRTLFASTGRESDGTRQIAAWVGSTKWIFPTTEPNVQKTYDLAADPYERHPLSNPALERVGAGHFFAYLALKNPRPAGAPVDPAPESPRPTPPTTLPLDAERVEKLRALGYLPP